MPNTRTRLKKARTTRRTRQYALIQAALKEGDVTQALRRAFDLYRAEYAACPNRQVADAAARRMVKTLYDQSLSDFPGGES